MAWQPNMHTKSESQHSDSLGISNRIKEAEASIRALHSQLRLLYSELLTNFPQSTSQRKEVSAGLQSLSVSIASLERQIGDFPTIVNVADRYLSPQTTSTSTEKP